MAAAFRALRALRAAAACTAASLAAAGRNFRSSSSVLSILAIRGLGQFGQVGEQFHQTSSRQRCRSTVEDHLKRSLDCVIDGCLQLGLGTAVAQRRCPAPFLQNYRTGRDETG